MILGLQDRETRDRAAEWMEGPEAGPALRLWRALARRCVGPYVEHAAAPLTLAGWVSWSTGDEAGRQGGSGARPAGRPRLHLRSAPAPGLQPGPGPGDAAPLSPRGAHLARARWRGGSPEHTARRCGATGSRASAGAAHLRRRGAERRTADRPVPEEAPRPGSVSATGRGPSTGSGGVGRRGAGAPGAPGAPGEGGRCACPVASVPGGGRRSAGARRDGPGRDALPGRRKHGPCARPRRTGGNWIRRVAGEHGTDWRRECLSSGRRL